MYVTILGKRYRFEFTRLRGRDCGICSDPTDTNKRIRIRRGMDEFTTLDTIIHETLHAADFWKREEWVDQVGTDLAKILWRLGYRREDVDDDPT